MRTHSPEKIRQLREQRVWTQEQLAENAGVSLRTIQRLEQRPRGSFYSLQRVAKALGVTVDELRQPPADNTPKGEAEGSRNSPGTVLPRVTTSTELIALITGAYAYSFDNDDLRSEEEVQLTSEFFRLLEDWGDMWDELPPSQRVQVRFSLQSSLHALQEKGLWVFGTQEIRNVKVGQEAFAWPVAIVRVVHKDNPIIIHKDVAIPEEPRTARCPQPRKSISVIACGTEPCTPFHF